MQHSLLSYVVGCLAIVAGVSLTAIYPGTRGLSFVRWHLRAGLLHVYLYLRHPPAFTVDRCRACNDQFHNRDRVLRIDGNWVHANADCSWTISRNTGEQFWAVDAEPYLVAKGTVRRI